MYAVATSGGKDSTLALHRALRQGLRVTRVLHLYGTEYARVRFHGYRPEMIASQAKALGIEAMIEPTRPHEFDEDFALALGKVKRAGLRGVVFGNISLEDVRDFYRQRVEATGLEYRDMLWQETSVRPSGWNTPSSAHRSTSLQGWNLSRNPIKLSSERRPTGA